MESSRPKISVIVPVYNVETYLKRCVDSILAQTERDLEIILVDDGSTDSSGELCDEYAAGDPRIRVHHKENGGLTSAWKAGLALASGEYTGFVDSDDWIDADMYERLLTKTAETGADMAVCGLVYEYEDEEKSGRREISQFDEEVYDRAGIESLFPTLINDGSFFGRHLQPARVTKLFRTEILRKNVKYAYDSVSVGEDFQITFPVILDADVLCVVKDFYPYHYWINDKSITGKYDSGYMEKVKLLAKRLTEISIDKKVYNFIPQIRNDFLSLTVLTVKNEICRSSAGRKAEVENLRKIFRMTEVREALEHHTMKKLSLSVRLYLWMMKNGYCTLCYLAVRLFFRNS